MAAGCLPVASTLAQETPDAGGAGESTSAPLPPELEGVPGIRPGMTTDEMVDAGLEAVRAQRLDDAEDILSVAVSNDREHVRALQVLGYVYESQAAAARADRSRADAQQKADAYVDRAVRTYLYAAPLAQDRGLLRVAEQMYKAVLLHQPANTDAQLGLARVLRQTERDVQAVEQYKAYLQSPRGKADSQAHLELGQIYHKLRFLNLAIAMLESARGLDPNNPEILSALAGAYQDANNPEKAAELVRSATEKAPDNPAYHHTYAIILYSQGELARARDEAALAISLSRERLRARPDDAELLTRLDQRYRTYRQILRAVLAQDEHKNNLKLWLDLAAVIRDHAEIAQTINLLQALQVLEGVTSIGSKNIPYLERLAELQFLVHRTDAAAETCREILDLEAGNPTARRILDSLGAATRPAGSDSGR
jgi:tetratricopeptide (TPR) repeat protein